MTEIRAGLLLVGCGKMGGAMLEGWLQRRIVDRVAIVEPHTPSTAAFRGRPGVTIHADSGAIGMLDPAVVVFATKPQGMEAVVPAYRRFAGARTVFLSIA